MHTPRTAPLLALCKSADGWCTFRTFGGFSCISWIKTPAPLHKEDHLLMFSETLVILHKQGLGVPPVWDKVGTTQCSAAGASPAAAWCSILRGRQHSTSPAQRHRGSTGCAGEHLLCPPAAALTAERRQTWEQWGTPLSAPGAPDSEGSAARAPAKPGVPWGLLRSSLWFFSRSTRRDSR